MLDYAPISVCLGGIYEDAAGGRTGRLVGVTAYLARPHAVSGLVLDYWLELRDDSVEPPVYHKLLARHARQVGA